MMMDPIADLLTRIRNAQQAGIEKIEMNASRILIAIATILKEEGYVVGAKPYNYKGRRYIRLILKYDDEGRGVIREIKRVSRPGRRVYSSAANLPRVKNGYGIAVVSTSRGVMTDKKAREANIGGEILCTVF